MPESSQPRRVVFIASPLEPEHVERIRAVDPARLEVVYDPDLLPPTRYVADHGGVPGFARTTDQEARWRAALERAEILWDFPGRAADGTEGIDSASRVRWIQATSSGVGQRAERLRVGERGILVTTAKGVHAGPLSEFVLLVLLTHAKRVRHVAELQREHRWERFCGTELAGRTLAVIGTGQVGRRTLAVARCLGMRAVAWRRPGSDRTANEVGADEMFAPEALHDMLGQADAVVLAVPHTPQTEGLFDRAAFTALREGAVFVNIARGAVVDEDALIESLRSGRIALAGLDVFRTEPLPADSPLWDLPNVIVSPHSASTADSENRKIADIFCRNLSRYLDGRRDEMENLYDPTRGY